ncbi:MAG: nitroreductase family protein [Spirochaetaceae bacterium]|jgi:predicted oxidoreductase (fatty acid repression mutant protein)|nr:nitroreductase family protein [Spirochaetaceae bacterium]
MTQRFLNLASARRTIYALGKNVNVPQADLESIIGDALKFAPSAFNNQSVRAALLFNKRHDELWDIVADCLGPKLAGADARQKFFAKVAAFKAAYGTALFFTDGAVVKEFEELYPAYAAHFHDWAEQAQGNANYAVWLALHDNGIGASLQHYNPAIDEAVRRAFAVPASWILRAQMPFGSVEAAAGDKSFIAPGERCMIFS